MCHTYTYIQLYTLHIGWLYLFLEMTDRIQCWWCFLLWNCQGQHVEQNDSAKQNKLSMQQPAVEPNLLWKTYDKGSILFDDGATKTRTEIPVLCLVKTWILLEASWSDPPTPHVLPVASIQSANAQELEYKELKLFHRFWSCACICVPLHNNHTCRCLHEIEFIISSIDIAIGNLFKIFTELMSGGHRT